MGNLYADILTTKHAKLQSKYIIIDLDIEPKANVIFTPPDSFWQRFKKSFQKKEDEIRYFHYKIDPAGHYLIHKHNAWIRFEKNGNWNLFDDGNTYRWNGKVWQQRVENNRNK